MKYTDVFINQINKCNIPHDIVCFILFIWKLSFNPELKMPWIEIWKFFQMHLSIVFTFSHNSEWFLIPLSDLNLSKKNDAKLYKSKFHKLCILYVILCWEVKETKQTMKQKPQHSLKAGMRVMEEKETITWVWDPFTLLMDWLAEDLTLYNRYNGPDQSHRRLSGFKTGK